MNRQFAVENITNAIIDIVLPKFNSYIESRTKDNDIQEKINTEIKKIENAEDVIFEMTRNITFKNRDYIQLQGFVFFYDEHTDEFKLGEDKEYLAKNLIFYKEGLSDSWSMEHRLRTRILAIVSGAKNDTFENILALVEDQIDFIEFIKPNSVE